MEFKGSLSARVLEVETLCASSKFKVSKIKLWRVRNKTNSSRGQKGIYKSKHLQIRVEETK